MNHLNTCKQRFQTISSEEAHFTLANLAVFIVLFSTAVLELAVFHLSIFDEIPLLTASYPRSKTNPKIMQCEHKFCKNTGTAAYPREAVRQARNAQRTVIGKKNTIKILRKRSFCANSCARAHLTCPTWPGIMASSKKSESPIVGTFWALI